MERTRKRVKSRREIKVKDTFRRSKKQEIRSGQNCRGQLQEVPKNRLAILFAGASFGADCAARAQTGWLPRRQQGSEQGEREVPQRVEACFQLRKTVCKYRVKLQKSMVSKATPPFGAAFQGTSLLLDFFGCFIEFRLNFLSLFRPSKGGYSRFEAHLFVRCSNSLEKSRKIVWGNKKSRLPKQTAFVGDTLRKFRNGNKTQENMESVRRFTGEKREWTMDKTQHFICQKEKCVFRIWTGGQTVGDFMKPKIKAAYETGCLPAMLPMLEKGKV